MRVSAKLVLKAAENGDLEYLTKVVNTDNSFEKSLDWITKVDKKGRTPLHLSSMNGHIYIVRLIWRIISEFTKDIYARTVYLDVVDHKGRTALFHAAAGGYLNICSYLVDRHAKMDVCTNENHPSPGSTGLMACAEKNNVDCFKMLFRKGAGIACPFGWAFGGGVSKRCRDPWHTRMHRHDTSLERLPMRSM